MAADLFNYFSEIEERFCHRRGTAVLLSTLDWALIETWKAAEIPLEAVLRGIDEAFDRYYARPKKTRRINSLAYCAQQVLEAAEQAQGAAVGAKREPSESAQGLESERIASYLLQNAAALGASAAPASARTILDEAAAALTMLAEGLKTGSAASLEDVERRLTMLEEKLLAALLTATPDDELTNFRAEAERELAPYRRKMTGPQIDHLLKQYLHKRLLERYRVPRLSLFYL